MLRERDILAQWSYMAEGRFLIPSTKWHRLSMQWLPSKRLGCTLTAIYGLHPASLVLAMESTSCPLMPKSQSLIFPLLSRRILEGLISARDACHSVYNWSIKQLQSTAVETTENFESLNWDIQETKLHLAHAIIYLCFKHTSITKTKSGSLFL